MTKREFPVTAFGVVPGSTAVQTAGIQAAIDAAGAEGGTVRFPAGTCITGTLRLRSGVTLQLDAGAVLQGSVAIADYDRRYWGGGLITAEDARGIALMGPGVIDGADCPDPAGEEGFRGPHCISLRGCSDVTIRDLTVRRSANWAFNCVSCSGAVFDRLRIEGGHDGVDAMHCKDFAFTGCNFATGDDCIAGADNHDFTFTDCRFNTSCNAFRFSCIGLTVRNSAFTGPGTYAHKVTGRNEMLAAFLHFSPPGRTNCTGDEPQSDRWLIESCTVEQVGQLYEFDHRTLWQNGRPVRRVVFRDVTASGLRKPIWVCGDMQRQFHLTLERVHLAIPKGSWHHHPFVDLRSFDGIDVRGLTCQGVDDSHPAISTVDGLRSEIRELVCRPAS